MEYLDSARGTPDIAPEPLALAFPGGRGIGMAVGTMRRPCGVLPVWPAVLCAACGVLASVRAQAQGWNGSLALASDNLYRGLSLSSDRPAWLVDLRYPIGTDWTLGLGASGAIGERRPEQDSAVEQVVLRVDRHWQIDADWSARLGVAHYDEPWSFWRNQLRYDEISAAIGYRGRWSLSLALTPNRTSVYARSRYERSGVATWTEATFRQPIVERLAADFGVGYAALSHSGDHDYGYISTGLSYGIDDVDLYLAYVWTDATAPRYWWDVDGRPVRSRWLASVIWNF